MLAGIGPVKLLLFNHLICTVRPAAEPNEPPGCSHALAQRRHIGGEPGHAWARTGT
jgi:hypothetical protein